MKFQKMGLDSSKEIVELWNKNINKIYPIDHELFVQNYFNDRQNKKIMGAYQSGRLVGFIIYKQWSYKSGLLKPNNEIGYINSVIVDIKYRNRKIGTELLHRAENDLKNSGVKIIHAGGDTYHFFPGIPAQCLGAENFFSKKNYLIEENFYDLLCDISKVNIQSLPGIKLNLSSKYKTEILNPNDKKELYRFLEKNFSGRWYEEFIEFFEIGMENRDIVVLKHGDNIIGFVHIYDNKSKIIGPPIYWKGILGDNYGGLGPIGVDKDYRKYGLGLLILYRALEILKNRNVQKMVIDWTDKDIINFYGKFNFMPWKKYTKATKML